MLLLLSTLAQAGELTLQDLADLDTGTVSLEALQVSVGSVLRAGQDARLTGDLAVHTRLACAVDAAALEADCVIEQRTLTAAGALVQRDVARLTLAVDGDGGAASYTGWNDGGLLGFRSTAAVASVLAAGALGLMGDDPYLGSLPDSIRYIYDAGGLGLMGDDPYIGGLPEY